MKSESVVRKRAERLRDRYLRRYVALSQERRHENCVHNREYLPRKLPYSQSDLSTELDLAPRKVMTLLVIQEERPVRVCMYGAERPAEWSGDICDDDSISPTCKFFVPLKTVSEATDEFMSLLADDKYVYDSFRDLAALQWVLGDRRPRLPWYRRLASFFVGKYLPKVPVLPSPGASEEVDRELENIWRE